MHHDFTGVTELPGSQATREQHERLYHRYHVARQHATGKRVLEVACGAGMGLGYLKGAAKSVIGGDYTEKLLLKANEHYRNSVPLVRLDGQELPFRNRSFDVILLYEAIYYLGQPERFILECRRVLGQDGILLISTVNKDWNEFSPSILSVSYLSVPELRGLLQQCGFPATKLFGAFPSAAVSVRRKMVSIVRRTAATLHMVPGTLAGRQLLKRLFYGELTPIGPEVYDGMAEHHPLEPISGDIPEHRYKIIYAIARAT